MDQHEPCKHDGGVDREPADPSVGIMTAAEFCAECGEDVTNLESDDDYDGPDDDDRGDWWADRAEAAYEMSVYGP